MCFQFSNPTVNNPTCEISAADGLGQVFQEVIMLNTVTEYGFDRHFPMITYFEYAVIFIFMPHAEYLGQKTD